MLAAKKFSPDEIFKDIAPALQLNDMCEEAFEFGLLEKCGDDYHFIHGTFAKYFLADYLFVNVLTAIQKPTNIKNNKKGTNIKRAFLKILSSRDFSEVHTFLNRMLEDDNNTRKIGNRISFGKTLTGNFKGRLLSSKTHLHNNSDAGKIVNALKTVLEETCFQLGLFFLDNVLHAPGQDAEQAVKNLLSRTITNGNTLEGLIRSSTSWDQYSTLRTIMQSWAALQNGRGAEPELGASIDDRSQSLTEHRP